MSWNPAYQARFAKPLVNQLIALIQRDQVSALAVINAARAVQGNPPLCPITEFHKGPWEARAWPWLYLGIGTTTFNRNSDKTVRESECRITLALDVGQYDQEMAQEDAQDYARLLDMVITSAGPWPSLSDWTAALAIHHETVPYAVTTAPPAGTVNDVFVESHIPSQVSLHGGEAPIMRISLTVLFELEEV
jgi:hypothetical protein